MRTLVEADKTMGIGTWIAGLVTAAVMLAPKVNAAEPRDPQPTSETKAVAASYDRAADPHTFTVFMEEGGWCWYQDPRAIVHKGHLIIGSVQGTGSGPALIGIYDLSRGKRLGSFVARDNFDRDDHNSPVFYPRPDGSVLAMYARHGREQVHYYRISDRQNYLEWGKEMRIEYPDFLGKKPDGVTYMNLFHMSAEGKLYCFFRGLEFNPCLVTSADQGRTWEGATHFIRSEIKGRHRPYVRYAGNSVDRIHLSFTDAHPRNFGNSIYYALFRAGKFYKADGTFIKDLKLNGPLLPSQADLVFQGGGQFDGGKHGLSASNSAWTSSMVYDADGHPHIGYSYYLSNTDHRYRIASWDGSKWIDRQVAYAGKCLDDRESSYTGLITLDPVDPSVVFISTDVDPTSGTDSGGQHEIYRAQVGGSDDVDSIEWDAVTQNSPVRNIRPVILRDGDKRVVLWNRGDFVTFVNYQLDTVGFVEKAAASINSTRHLGQRISE